MPVILEAALERVKSRDTPAVLSCVNLKGGVGKTALAVNFAAYCGQWGLRTLLIDMDPQTNATVACIGFEEWKSHATKKGTVADLLGARQFASAEGATKPVKTVIRKEVFPSVDLIPSHLDLFTIDLDKAGETSRETMLRRAIKPALADYEVIVCDCPPNLTLPTQNALAISTHYVVPISPDFLSGLGIGLLKTRIEKIASVLEIDVDFLGVVISRVGRPAQHRSEIMNSLRAELGNKVLQTVITERVAVAKAAEKHQPVFKCKDSVASRQFRTVSMVLLNRMGPQS